MPTHSQLEALVGQHISQICRRGYSNDSDNHCAHFVSHVLGYQFGATCKTMSRGQGADASIRVQELFAKCSSAGTWDTRPVTAFWGLIFTTNAANVDLASQTMTNVPRKHVGIFFGVVPQVWHYSNAQRRVARQSPEHFKHHYASPDDAIFWGMPP